MGHWRHKWEYRIQTRTSEAQQTLEAIGYPADQIEYQWYRCCTDCDKKQMLDIDGWCDPLPGNTDRLKMDYEKAQPVDLL